MRGDFKAFDRKEVMDEARATYLSALKSVSALLAKVDPSARIVTKSIE
jgi:hypothetical protein